MVYGNHKKVVSFDNVSPQNHWDEAQAMRMSFLLQGDQDAVMGDALLSFHPRKITGIFAFAVDSSNVASAQRSNSNSDRPSSTSGLDSEDYLIVLIVHEDGILKVWRFSYRYDRWDFLKKIILPPFERLASSNLKIVSVDFDIQSKSLMWCQTQGSGHKFFEVFISEILLRSTGKRVFTTASADRKNISGSGFVLGSTVKVCDHDQHLNVMACSGYFYLESVSYPNYPLVFYVTASRTLAKLDFASDVRVIGFG